jgi:hypothetical protein
VYLGFKNVFATEDPVFYLYNVFYEYYLSNGWYPDKFCIFSASISVENPELFSKENFFFEKYKENL